jgi:uncharacterized protein YeaO (DUF488 family)
MNKPELTGYFIKDVKQYAEFSEKIGELKLSKSEHEIKKLKDIQEEYLIELVKRYS